MADRSPCQNWHEGGSNTSASPLLFSDFFDEFSPSPVEATVPLHHQPMFSTPPAYPQPSYNLAWIPSASFQTNPAAQCVETRMLNEDPDLPSSSSTYQVLPLCCSMPSSISPSSDKLSRSVPLRQDGVVDVKLAAGCYENETASVSPSERESPRMDPTVLLNQAEGTSSQSIGIPKSEVFPGACGFKVKFPKDKYRASTNSLVIRPDISFASMFIFEKEPPPKGSFVRVLVCCKNPKDVLKIGPCQRCLRHPTTEKFADKPSSNHFLLCKNEAAVYGSHESHKIVTVPLDAMPVNEVGPTCVYMCVCHSTCVVGRGRNKPTLILIYSLIHNGNEIGRDVVNLRSCSNPVRDSGKLKRSAEESNGESEQDDVSSPPFRKVPRHFDLYGFDPDQDDEGYYNFTWRGKERIIFNLLNLVATGQRNGPDRR